jgi:hypothetical protein
MTTLPKWTRLSKYRYASGASSNGNTRATTGRNRCGAIRVVHRLEIGPTADADRTERHAAPAEQQRIEHDAGSRQARADQADMPADGQRFDPSLVERV